MDVCNCNYVLVVLHRLIPERMSVNFLVSSIRASGALVSVPLSVEHRLRHHTAT